MGHREKIQQAAKDGPLSFLSEMRRRVDNERRELARRASEFELRPPRKDDTFGELQPQEKRAFLRSLPNMGERIRLAGSDPEFAAAAVHGHQALSGLDAQGYERACKFLIESLHGDELKRLADEHEELDVAESALTVAEQQIRSLAD